MRDVQAQVRFNNKITGDVCLMGIQWEGRLPQMRPGQFVMVRVGRETDPLLRRPFSICGISEGNTVLILYKIVGKGTHIMGEMSEGDELQVLGPIGNGFQLPEKDKKAILIAGGIGIAPLIFLAREMAGYDIELFAGFGTSSDIIRPGEIGIRAGTVQIATEDGSEGHRGFITDLLAQRLELPASGNTVVYACGPMPMLKEVSSLCFKYRVPCQVSLETSMACGLGACLGCAVKRAASDGYYYVCKDGPVFDARQIGW